MRTIFASGRPSFEEVSWWQEWPVILHVTGADRASDPPRDRLRWGWETPSGEVTRFNALLERAAGFAQKTDWDAYVVECAEEYGVPLQAARAIFKLLGPSEAKDGFIAELEDYAVMSGED